MILQSVVTQSVTIETSKTASSSVSWARFHRAEKAVTSSGLISPSMNVKSGRLTRTMKRSLRLKTPMMSETKMSSIHREIDAP